MGRVLVKPALPSKVLVKFDDDYEYAYDANNNLVLVQSPKSRGRPTTRGERVASVVGNVAGVGRSLLQPANTFSQFLSNLRTGAQLGGQDVRGLYRNFLETRGARRRAENRQAVADRNERQDELFRQAVERGQIQTEGPRFGGTSRQQRQNALAELRAAQDTAGQRRKEMEALGERLARDAEPTGQDPSDFYGSMKQIVGQVPDMAGDSGRIDVPQIPLPNQFTLQHPELMADIEQELQTVMPREGDVTLTKPSRRGNTVKVGGTVLVNGQSIQPDEQGNYTAPGVNITGSIIGGGKEAKDAARRAMGETLAAGGSNADAKAAMHEAIMQSMNQPPESVEQPIVNVAGKKIGVVGSGEAVTAMKNIPPPADDMGAANAKEQEMPTTTTVNPAMDRFNQMKKPEPVEEEGGQQQPPSMLSNIQAKMKGYTPEVEA